MSNHSSKVVILTIVFMTFTMLSAVEFNKAKLDSLFNLLETNTKAMGSIAVSHKGEVVYSRALGYRLIREKQKVASDVFTKYRIGSITKMFTAVMVFQLIEEGKLTLDTKLDRFFPKVPDAGKITIANMLSHRSGIYSFTEDPKYPKWCTKPTTHKHMLKRIQASKPVFAPDSRTEYSNSNYLLLGYIVEDLCNKSYSEALQERILARIGLTDTYVGGKTDIKKHESYSYEYIVTYKQVSETEMSVPGGAGAIVSTPTDLTKFITCLFTHKLVSDSSLSQMQNVRDELGMGLMEMHYNEHKGFGHTGQIDGFSSLVEYFPEDSLAIAYVSNGLTYSFNGKFIEDYALDTWFGMPYELPSFKKKEVKLEDLKLYTGIYTGTELPLKLKLTLEKGTLTGKLKGQPSFPLTFIGKDSFLVIHERMVIEFHLADKALTLKQDGKIIHFQKKK